MTMHARYLCSNSNYPNDDICMQTQKFKCMRIHETFKNEKQVLVFVLFMRTESNISIVISQTLSCHASKLSTNKQFTTLLCLFFVFFFPTFLKEILGSNKTWRAIAGLYFFIYTNVYQILSRQTSFRCKWWSYRLRILKFLSLILGFL